MGIIDNPIDAHTPLTHTWYVNEYINEDTNTFDGFGAFFLEVFYPQFLP
jgi:hypothetical protein